MTDEPNEEAVAVSTWTYASLLKQSYENSQNFVIFFGGSLH